jgi:hypothetical protein
MRAPPPPCPGARPWRPTGQLAGGFGFPERLLQAAAGVDTIAATLAEAALTARPRARYRPGLRNRLNTRLLTGLPTRASDRIKIWITGMASAAPPVVPGPDSAVPNPAAPQPHRRERRHQGAYK